MGTKKASKKDKKEKKDKKDKKDKKEKKEKKRKRVNSTDEHDEDTSDREYWFAEAIQAQEIVETAKEILPQAVEAETKHPTSAEEVGDDWEVNLFGESPGSSVEDVCDKVAEPICDDAELGGPSDDIPSVTEADSALPVAQISSASPRKDLSRDAALAVATESTSVEAVPPTAADARVAPCQTPELPEASPPSVPAEGEGLAALQADDSVVSNPVAANIEKPPFAAELGSLAVGRNIVCDSIDGSAQFLGKEGHADIVVRMKEVMQHGFEEKKRLLTKLADDFVQCIEAEDLDLFVLLLQNAVSERRRLARRSVWEAAEAKLKACKDARAKAKAQADVEACGRGQTLQQNDMRDNPGPADEVVTRESVNPRVKDNETVPLLAPAKDSSTPKDSPMSHIYAKKQLVATEVAESLDSGAVTEAKKVEGNTSQQEGREAKPKSAAEVAADVAFARVKRSKEPDLQADRIWDICREMQGARVVVQDGHMHTANLRWFVTSMVAAADRANHWETAWQRLLLNDGTRQQVCTAFVRELLKLMTESPEVPQKIADILAWLTRGHRVKLKIVEDVIKEWTARMLAKATQQQAGTKVPEVEELLSALFVHWFPMPKIAGWGWSRVGWSWHEWWKTVGRITKDLSPMASFEVLLRTLESMQKTAGDVIYNQAAWDPSRIEKLQEKLQILAAVQGREELQRLLGSVCLWEAPLPQASTTPPQAPAEQSKPELATVLPTSKAKVGETPWALPVQAAAVPRKRKRQCACDESPVGRSRGGNNLYADDAN
eukprot:TRINITY_DN28836_c0_g1_i1.p1 TRINITY_DN28836_c0_g1~~TRINITY_DN28836_c0_g1_i1.p1  ORF type:complete len:776 (+),score=174.92 TRINITY_DN28836_c0_g1_i1:94-2421(+)